jgi:NitT/TauT family transport system permease protein
MAKKGTPLGPWQIRLAQAGVVLVFLFIWEIAARFFVDKMFISPPTRVLGELNRLFATRGIPAAIEVTLFEVMTAFGIAIASGLAIAVMIGTTEFGRRTFMPLVLFLYGIPQITILPLFVLYFGIGPPAKIAFGVTHSVFPIIIAVVAGLEGTPRHLLVSARSMGASRWGQLRFVVLPHIVPSLFGGMRLAMTGALLGVLLAELYVSTAGIGYFTTLFTQNFDPTRLLGLISILAIIAVGLNSVARAFETWFLRWRRA